MHDSSADDPDLDELDALLLQCLEEGSADELDRVCEDRADLADELRRRYRLLGDCGLLAAEEPAPALPAKIGSFRILRRIGFGGMGVVYLAAQEPLDRIVALKILRPERLESKSARERFQRECTTLARLDHPGICPVYDVGEVDGQPYLAMRFIDGESLAAHLHRLRATRREGVSTATGSTTSAERARVTEVIRWFEKLARAVHAAHTAGLVHRDLKPANIMITKDGEPVILDFGLVRDERTDSGLTMTEDVVGTPAYLPPERIDGGSADARSDVYSLGVTLYETLTLQRPFDAVSRDALYRRILGGDHSAVDELNRCVSRDLAVVTATAMERDPGCRYATAQDLAEDLRRVRLLEPIRARPAPALLRLRRWTQRNPALAILIVALAAGLSISLVLLERIRGEVHTNRAILSSFNALLELGNLNPLDTDRLDLALGPSASYAELVRGWDRILARQPFESDAVESAVRYRLGTSLSYGGDLVSALANLERAHELFVRLGQHETAAACEAHTAWCLTGLGFACEGRRRADAVSRDLLRMAGPSDPSYLWARLCALHSYQHHLGPELLAENVREAEAIRRRLREDPDTRFPVFVADLVAATVFNQARQLERADAAMGEALAACERLTNDNNINRWMIRWQWSGIARRLGDTDRSRELYRQSVEIAERVIGAVDNDWLWLLHAPLNWLPVAGEEAADVLETLRARARGTRQRFGIENPRTIWSAIDLIRFMHQHPATTSAAEIASRLDALVALGREVLATGTPESANVRFALVELARCLDEHRRTDDARGIARVLSMPAEPENIDQAAARRRAADLLGRLGG